MSSLEVDVLCVGLACYDLAFSVEKQPEEDQKIVATDLISSGGGPAANAAIGIARLGLKAAFAGYLGNDLYGDSHLNEFQQHSVNTQLLQRGTSPTPLSTVLIKPTGKRSLINYKGVTNALKSNQIHYPPLNIKAMLFDGHEPAISIELLKIAKENNIPTILDAGSVHDGTLLLFDKVDYLVASEKFALQYAGTIEKAIIELSKKSANVVITLGDKGLVWFRNQQQGSLPAFKANIIDTTGAGDAFHAAFSAAIALNMGWIDCLEYASGAGTLCCTKIGARQGLPWSKEHTDYLKYNLPVRQ